MSDAKNDDKYRAMLRWRCRRGMLELDALLQDFFDQQFDSLSNKDKKTFEELLSHEDQQLWNCFIKQEPVGEDDLQQIVNLIRAARNDAI